MLERPRNVHSSSPVVQCRGYLLGGDLLATAAKGEHAPVLEGNVDHFPGAGPTVLMPTRGDNQLGWLGWLIASNTSTIKRSVSKFFILLVRIIGTNGLLAPPFFKTSFSLSLNPMGFLS